MNSPERSYPHTAAASRSMVSLFIDLAMLVITPMTRVSECKKGVYPWKKVVLTSGTNSIASDTLIPKSECSILGHTQL